MVSDPIQAAAPEELTQCPIKVPWQRPVPASPGSSIPMTGFIKINLLMITDFPVRSRKAMDVFHVVSPD